jgi:hypothetical protein
MVEEYKAWDELMASIKVGVSKASVLDRWRRIEARPAKSVNPGMFGLGVERGVQLAIVNSRFHSIAGAF